MFIPVFFSSLDSSQLFNASDFAMLWFHGNNQSNRARNGQLAFSD